MAERVTVRHFVEVGRDAHHEPVTEHVDEVVHGVIVQVANDKMMLDRNDETRVAWNLHFPKTYRAPLRGCHVLVRGAWYEVVGNPQPEGWSPIGWDYTVKVAVIDG